MYGGTILPGHCPGQETSLDAQSVIEVCYIITCMILHYNDHVHYAIGSRILWGRLDGY